MPKRKSNSIDSERPSRSNPSAPGAIEYDEREEFINANIIPNADDSDESDSDISTNGNSEDSSEDNSDSEQVDNSTSTFTVHSYDDVYKSYSSSQKKLENDHQYKWLDGEYNHNRTFTNEIFLRKSDKESILKSTPTNLFECFFTLELKDYIIECTKINGCEMSRTELDVFIGIIIFTKYNKRLSQRDYWSMDPHLRAEPIVSAMSPLSIDEMMLKFYGRTGKPVRFGIKLWALCSANGYIFDFEIYCGKNSYTDGVLSKCALGSRVVVNMLQVVFSTVSLRNRDRLHIYFNNLFTSPDLLIHLKNYGLCATGTVRENRVGIRNSIQKKDDRGKYEVKHDQNSGFTLLTVMDSKPVSILSTAAGATPIGPVLRRQKSLKDKRELDFPRAFLIYNKFMGGVDLHGQPCNKIEPIIRSKKWTWIIFIRLIQTSITNAVTEYNIANQGEGVKKSIKDFAMGVGKNYLNRSCKNSESSLHETKQLLRKPCDYQGCKIRTRKFCSTCSMCYCGTCFKTAHPQMDGI
ncbi:piggyBac transposable element-derived protein 3-like [Prorops nasuta]|uniref:piggyBac transposable element-derived protein 3-like n=1 Tax=Prorops nasuta TaxID=863751 RepID=UPI0034CF42D1